MGAPGRKELGSVAASYSGLRRPAAAARRRASRSRSASAARPYRLIGLTGTNAAGKGEIAAYLAAKGYQAFSLSDVIREDLRRRGLEVNRDNLIARGNALRQRYGADILARRIMKKIRGKAVIDSLRNTREVAFFRKHPGFVLVAVDAPVEVRFRRARKRGRLESAATLDAFAAKEREEMAGGRDGQQLRRCLEAADLTITNGGTLAALRRKVDRCLL
jgi:dephospho-CoA kinase